MLSNNDGPYKFSPRSNFKIKIFPYFSLIYGVKMGSMIAASCIYSPIRLQSDFCCFLFLFQLLVFSVKIGRNLNGDGLCFRQNFVKIEEMMILVLHSWYCPKVNKILSPMK